MIFPVKMCTKFATLTGTALLCGSSLWAQAPMGSSSQSSPSSMQQPGSPGNTVPGASTTPSGTMSPGMNSDMNMQNGQTSPMDKAFVKKALEGGMAEIQLGQLALQKSNNDDVKQFAQKMIDDHGKMGDQMKPIAQQIGVPVPDGPSSKDKATMNKMQGLSGDAFDKAYVKDMVKDHKTDLSEFKAESQRGSNPAVKDAATQGSQIISEHLQMIQQISQKTSGSGGSSSGGSK